MKKIGNGAYGTVYLQDGIAIKEFSSPGTGKSMITEVVASKYLEKCPNILTINDFDLENRRHYSKFYDSNMKQFIRSVSGLDEEQLKLSRRPHRLTNEERLNLISLSTMTQEEKIIKMKTIFDAVVYMHQRDIVHCDLKPSNILYDKEKEEFVIADLGFVLPSKYTKCNRTAKHYREPEPKNHVSHDIYSLGIIMIEFLCNVSIRKIYNFDKLESFCCIYNKNIKNLVVSMINPNYEERPTIRKIYYVLYGIRIAKRNPTFVNKTIDDKMLNIIKINKVGNRNRCYQLQLYIESKYKLDKMKSIYYSMYICSLLFGGNVSARILMEKVNIKSQTMLEKVSVLLKDKNIAKILYEY